MEELMLKIDSVSKLYKLGQIGGTTLRDELQRKMAKLRKKEDPTMRIGTKSHQKGETFLALDGVSFEVKRGERVGIIGHNGAGKSTLLKLISRVTAPTGGVISMNGRVASMLEVGTGFHMELTGRENIYMNGAILGMTKKEIDAKMEDIIDFSECRQFIDTPVKRYSSGMYVKLAFSVAAHLDAEIVIMDEVLAVGDMAFQKKCLNKMNDVSRQDGRTILYVSHNMSTVRQLCDRVVVLSHGKVIFDGDVESGIDRYMDIREETSQTEFDLSGKRMLYLPATVLAKMTYLRLLAKSKAVYAAGERIEFCLRVHAEKTVDNMLLRMELKYGDDSPVGTAIFAVLGAISKGDTVEYTLSFDPSLLASGNYKALFVIYEMNEFGSYNDLDAVCPAFYFTFEDGRNIHWDLNHWGHVCFPDLRAVSRELVEEARFPKEQDAEKGV